MKKKKKNNTKKSILTVLISIVVVIGAVLIIFGKADIVVKTTDNNYDVNCNFMLVSKGDTKLINEKVKNHLSDLESAYSIMTKEDSEIDNEFDNNVFAIEEYIYYYRNNSDKLYRYNTKEYKIEELETSKFINNNDDNTSIGIRTIDSEALLNYYPSIIKYIEELDGVYKHQIFYDKDRIFFIVDNDVYEYHILRDRIRLVMKDIDENIEYIFVK